MRHAWASPLRATLVADSTTHDAVGSQPQPLWFSATERTDWEYSPRAYTPEQLREVGPDDFTSDQDFHLSRP